MKYLLILHRYLGIICTFFVLILSLTGIVLLRSDQFELGTRPTPAWIAQTFYQLPLPEVQSFATPHGYWFHGDRRIFHGDRFVFQQDGEMLGAYPVEFGTLLLFRQKLVFVSSEYDLIDTLSSEGITGQLSSFSDYVSDRTEHVLFSDHGTFKSTDLFTWSEVAASASPSSIQQIQNTQPPALERSLLSVQKQCLGYAIPWERFALDLHSGRIAFGPWGPSIMEISAWGLIFLCLSGVYIFCIKFPKGKAQRKRLRRRLEKAVARNEAIYRK